MASSEWVTLSYAEYQRLTERLTRAERFLQDRPTLAQEIQTLTLRAQIAETARDAAVTEAARLRAELAVAPVPGSVRWQLQLVSRLVDLLLERFVPVGLDVRLQRCRVCGLVSVERELPSVLDHDPRCPARELLRDWFAAAGGHPGEGC